MSGRLQYSNFMAPDAFQASFKPTCAIIDPGNFFKAATPVDTVAQTAEIDVMAIPGAQQQTEEQTVTDPGLSFNVPTKVTRQFVVDSSQSVTYTNTVTNSPNDYTVNVSPVMSEVLQIKLVHASIPNPRGARYCIIKVGNSGTNMSGLQLSGNSSSLQDAFHVLPVSIDPQDSYFFNIPVYMPVVMESNTSINQLNISILDPSGNLYDFTDNAVQQHHLLIFEIETRA